MQLDVAEYIQENGLSPYAKWFNSLPSQAAAKVAAAKAKIATGNTSAIKWFDGLGEYRIHWGKGIRIYLARDGDKLIILFGGGDKSTQKKDITEAKRLLSEYKRRKAQRE